MIWIFIFLIFAVSVVAIAYPLFWSKLQKYTINYTSTTDFSKTTFWLSSLSDLDDDFTLGKITKIDYQKQKLILQRSYLESLEKE